MTMIFRQLKILASERHLSVLLPKYCSQIICDITLFLQGFPFGDFNLEDVMLPEDDDMGIPSDDDEDLEDEVTTETGFGCVVGEWAYLVTIRTWRTSSTHSMSYALLQKMSRRIICVRQPPAFTPFMPPSCGEHHCLWWVMHHTHTAAVLDNLPKVEAAKYDKLAGVVRKIISQVGVSIRGGATSCMCPSPRHTAVALMRVYG